LKAFNRCGQSNVPDAQIEGEAARARARTTTASALGLLLLVAGVVVLTQQALVRGLEARSAARLAHLVGLVPARSIGSSVIFPIRGRFVGYTVSEGCTVAFLVAPFFLIAAVLIASGHTAPRRGLRALALVTIVLFAANQARLFVIAASMRALGYESGYELSHVFLGTVLTTLGAVIGLLIFVWLVVGEGGPDNRRHRWVGVA